jgi:hypothetical protein
MARGDWMILHRSCQGAMWWVRQGGGAISDAATIAAVVVWLVLLKPEG